MEKKSRWFVRYAETMCLGLCGCELYTVMWLCIEQKWRREWGDDRNMKYDWNADKMDKIENSRNTLNRELISPILNY